MLSSGLTWHFFPRENRVLETWFIYRPLYPRFVCDVFIHVEPADLWVPPRNRVSETQFLIGFFKNKPSLTPLSLSLSHIPLHSLSLTLSLSLSRLSHTLSTLSRSRLSTLTHTPSHTRVSPPSHRHPLMLAPLSLSRLSHSPFPLSLSLHSQAPSPLSVSSLKYDFLIVWFFHVGLWFLFQNYDWFDCFVCYFVWFPRKCEKNFLFCAEIVVFEKI